MAFQLGPVVHFHVDEHDTEHVEAEHPHGFAAHVHVDPNGRPTAEDGGPKVVPVDGDEDLVELSWLQSERPQTPHALPAGRSPARAVTPVVAVVGNPPQEPRIHDPPFASSIIPRAPPA